MKSAYKFFLVLLSLMFLMGQYLMSTSMYLVERSRFMTIVAVRQTTSGVYEGVSADLHVKVACPGNGHVFVETTPLSELDVQASARVAAMVASTIANISFTACDYFISIRANTSIIGGPSASAAISVAIASAILDISLNNSIVITGMILPDGSIGPVGGLAEKLKVAASSGARVFVIPHGQIITTDYMVEEVRESGIVKQVVKQVEVDITKLGEQLGLQVVPASTIYEALEIATNKEFRSPAIVNTTTVLNKYIEVLKPVLTEWITDEVLDINQTLSEADHKLTDSDLSASMTSFVNDVKSKVFAAMNEARRYEDQGLLYAASSRYFQALIYAKWLNYAVDLHRNNNSFDYSFNRINESAHVLLSIIKLKTSKEPLNINTLSIIVGSASRVLESIEYLGNAVARWKTNDLLSTAYYLGFADARLKTAYMWLKLEKISSGLLNSTISSKELEQVASSIAILARDVVSYVYALRATSPQDIWDAMTYVHRALSEENAIIKLALAVEAYGIAYNSLVTSFTQDYMGVVAESLLRSSDYLLNELQQESIIPTSVVLYRELAKAYSETPSLLCYALSKLNAEMFSYLYMVRIVSESQGNKIQEWISSATSAQSTSKGQPLIITSTTTMQIAYEPIIAVSIILGAVVLTLITILLVFIRKHSATI